MKTRMILLLVAGLAVVLAIPAAAPASQPQGGVLEAELRGAMPLDAEAFNMLLASPQHATDLSIELPEGFTDLAWINEDPFAR